MANLLIETLYSQARKFRNREVYCSRSPENMSWISTSWKQFLQSVEEAACSLVALDCKEFDKVLICSFNRPEILIIEYAAFLNRMASVPVFARSSQAQFDFIAQDSGAQVFIVDVREQYEMARKYSAEHPGAVRHIILTHDDRSIIDSDDTTTITFKEFMSLGQRGSYFEEVKRRSSEGIDSDLAALIYTSGTTGNPKGVILNHRQFDAALRIHESRLEQVTENEVSLSYLPMSHVFEKAWLMFCLSRGVRIAFNHDPADISRSLREIHPNTMCCVPRFWEKAYAANVDYINSLPWLQRRMLNRAFRIGKRRNLHYRRLGLRTPGRVEREYKFWDRKVFSKLRETMGMSHSNIFPTAGAKLNDKITGYLIKTGIDVAIGYGLTETTTTVTCFPKHGFVVGTVGKTLPEVEIKIDNSGEILVKGPNVTPGYYNDPEATAEAFTEDGYFRTGDAGYILRDGSLVLTDRKKDLLKTSYGKYIAPSAIEALFASDEYIDRTAVIAEGRKYVAALVVPDFDRLERWATENGIPTDNRKKLCADQRVVNFIMQRIEDAQKDLAEYEKIRKIALLSKPFTMENGELTSTLKLRRAVVAERYSAIIENLFPDNVINATPLFESRMK